jgi:hypothetical protein
MGGVCFIVLHLALSTGASPIAVNAATITWVEEADRQDARIVRTIGGEALHVMESRQVIVDAASRCGQPKED